MPQLWIPSSRGICLRHPRRRRKTTETESEVFVLRSPRRISQIVIALLAFALLSLPALAASKKPAHKHKASSSSTSSKGKLKRTSARKGAWKHHGQQGIQEERAREIQEALIREHYMSGEADGNWDARTQAAMQKYQGDNGWQTKVLPDSRALIKLGLGPDHTGLLNPETAAVPVAVVPVAGSGIRQ
jgi:peptidoglycan hydrolase-like protein with peptidoglycan-binding domain